MNCKIFLRARYVEWFFLISKRLRKHFLFPAFSLAIIDNLQSCISSNITGILQEIGVIEVRYIAANRWSPRELITRKRWKGIEWKSTWRHEEGIEKGRREKRKESKKKRCSCRISLHAQPQTGTRGKVMVRGTRYRRFACNFYFSSAPSFPFFVCYLHTVIYSRANCVGRFRDGANKR